MRKRNFQFTVYLALTIIFGLTVFAFQVFRWNDGHLVYNTIDHAWDIQIKSAQSTCAIITFIFACLTFLHKGRKRLKDRDNFLYLAFLFLFIGDFFFLIADFSRTTAIDINENLGGFICYLIAYNVLMVYWKPKAWEWIVRLFGAALIPFIYYLLRDNFDAVNIVNAEVAFTLFMNVIVTIIHYVKERSYFSYYLMMSMVFAFGNILFMYLRVDFMNIPFLANMIAILVWPFYLTSCVLLNHLYRKF